MSGVGNYSKRTISVFEIVGAYFVDMFYNHLYLTARSNHRAVDTSVGSLTDVYKSTVNAYVKGLKSEKKYYESAVKGMTEFYKAHTKHTAITMTEFINEVIRQFMPPDHFDILAGHEKDFFMNNIVLRIVDDFADEVFAIEKMRLVIDSHADESNTRVWMDCIVSIQICIRESMYSKFIKTTNQSTGMVDEAVVKKVLAERDAIWRKTTEYLQRATKAEADLEHAKKVCQLTYDKLVAAEEKNAILQKTIDSISVAAAPVEPLVAAASVEPLLTAAPVEQPSVDPPDNIAADMTEVQPRTRQRIVDFDFLD